MCYCLVVFSFAINVVPTNFKKSALSVFSCPLVAGHLSNNLKKRPA